LFVGDQETVAAGASDESSEAESSPKS
jgi:hypothetical protein